MSSKQVIFYQFQEDQLEVITKIATKIYDSEKKLLIWFSDQTLLEALNKYLWTFSQLSFIPHGSKQTVRLEDAERCAIWLSSSLEFLNSPSVLLLKQDKISDNRIQQFEQIIDLSTDDLEIVRSHSKFFKQVGFLAQKMWVQKNGKWEEQELPA